MIAVAQGLLWFAIGVIILGAVVWIVITVLKRFFPSVFSGNVEYAVWAVFGILCLIYLLQVVEGGGHFPAWR